MKPKTWATALLLLFVAASVVHMAVRPSREAAEVAGPAKVPAGSPGTVSAAAPGKAGEPARRVVAYYFHGRVRCVSCKKIEELSAKAIRAGFAGPLRDGRLAFLDVNVDDPANRHFVDEFRLSGQSLVIVEIRDGKTVRWKNLEKVWTLLDSEGEFIPYVQEGVSAFLRNV